jgi:hypothetical protein
MVVLVGWVGFTHSIDVGTFLVVDGIPLIINFYSLVISRGFMKASILQFDVAIGTLQWVFGFLLGFNYPIVWFR